MVWDCSKVHLLNTPARYSIWRWIWPATFTNSVHETIDLPQYMIAFTPEDAVTFWMIQTHENQGILSKRKWRNTLLDPEDPFE